MAGDEGIYLHTRFLTIRLPLAETFIITEGKDKMLTAHHSMWLFGLEFYIFIIRLKKLHRSKKGLDGFPSFLCMGNCHRNLFI